MPADGVVRSAEQALPFHEGGRIPGIEPGVGDLGPEVGVGEQALKRRGARLQHGLEAVGIRRGHVEVVRPAGLRRDERELDEIAEVLDEPAVTPTRAMPRNRSCSMPAS